MNQIELRGMTKDYGNEKGVFSVSFSVKEGEVMGFLGPNGAGKTTTLRTLMGFIRPDSGEASIAGMDCFARAHEIKENLGYLPGEIAFPEGMKGREFLRFEAGMRGKKDTGRARELLERFELSPDFPISKMSKGTKQKLGIVCAFMHDPAVLLLDEPTSGLDPLMQGRFVDLLLEERGRGKTILMSSHIFEETERVCHKAAIIRAGKLAGVEDMEKLRRSRLKRWTVDFATEQEARAFGVQFSQAEIRGKQGEILWGGQADELIKGLSRFHVEEASAAAQTLEELFLSYYQAEKGESHE